MNPLDLRKIQYIFVIVGEESGISDKKGFYAEKNVKILIKKSEIKI